ncbi:hypothetical protein SLS56_011738 [Neofusicoccum ribis]|uniref:Uncharacterized protein n=1 Tax=Neofusicoccum ribis TaxID=45134 RepID=A0ABR3SAS9_9PEZI
MPVQTLRDWLNQPDPHYTVKDGILPSTATTLDVVVNGWEEWLDLRESNINNLLGGLLDAEYQFPETPQPLHTAHRFIGNEDALKFAAISWNVYIVNTALRTVAEALGRRHLLWSAGGAARAVVDRFADWSAVLATDTGFERSSHIAGETKMFGSGFPARSDLLAADPAGLAKARKCLEQVLGYALGENTRYAYILTPFEVVFVRGKLDAGAPSSAHIPSPATGRAARPGRPQVAVVAWNAAGLSANMAMFVVHWLAAIDKSCAPAYPPIDEDDAYMGAGGEDASGVE